MKAQAYGNLCGVEYIVESISRERLTDRGGVAVHFPTAIRPFNRIPIPIERAALGEPEAGKVGVLANPRQCSQHPVLGVEEATRAGTENVDTKVKIRPDTESLIIGQEQRYVSILNTNAETRR